jgi:hypothetical protein
LRSAAGLRSSRSFAFTFRFGVFVAQLQAHFAIEALHALGVHESAFAAQRHRDPTIAIANARLRDLSDPLC